MNKLQIFITICVVAIILFLGFNSLKSVKVVDQKQTDQTVDDAAKSMVSPIINNQTPSVDTEVQD